MEEIFSLSALAIFAIIILFSFLFLYLLLKRKIELKIPISKKVIMGSPPPQRKKELDKVLKLQEKILFEIIQKIKKENPNISDEELSKRVLVEYEIEKKKYPELLKTKIRELKIKGKPQRSVQ
jgi:hypothetical protein